MTTLGEFKAEIFKAIGRDDAAAAVMARRGTNAGVFMIFHQFEPTERRKYVDLITVAGQTQKPLSVDFVRLFSIDKITNSTRNINMGFIPFHLYHGIAKTVAVSVFSATEGPFVWTYDSINLYYQPITGGVSYTLSTWYTQYPQRLVNDSDNCPYVMHEDVLLSYATAITFAFLEEGESQEQWGKISQTLGVSEKQSKDISTFMKGYLDYDLLFRTAGKSAAAAAA